MAQLNVSWWTWLLGLATTSGCAWKHTLDTHTQRFSKDFNLHNAARINIISGEVGQCRSLGIGKHFKIRQLLNRYCTTMEAVVLSIFVLSYLCSLSFFEFWKPLIICQNNPDQSEAHMSDSEPFREQMIYFVHPLPSMAAKWWSEQSVQGPDGVLSATKQSSFFSYEKSSTEGGRKQQWRTRNRPSDYFRGPRC